jgi:hypothetical protein
VKKLATNMKEDYDVLFNYGGGPLSLSEKNLKHFYELINKRIKKLEVQIPWPLNEPFLYYQDSPMDYGY